MHASSSTAGRRRAGILLTATAVGALVLAVPGTAHADPGPGHTDYLTAQPEATGLEPDAIALSGNGRWVAYAASAAAGGNESSPDYGSVSDVYVYDRSSRTRTLVSGPGFGFPDPADARNPSISDDGRFVAFDVASISRDHALAGRMIAICDRDPDGDHRDDTTESATGQPGGTCVFRGDETSPEGSPVLNEYPVLSADGALVAWNEDGLRSALASTADTGCAPACSPPTGTTYLSVDEPMSSGGSGRVAISADGEHAVVPVHFEATPDSTTSEETAAPSTPSSTAPSATGAVPDSSDAAQISPSAVPTVPAAVPTTAAPPASVRATTGRPVSTTPPVAAASLPAVAQPVSPVVFVAPARPVPTAMPNAGTSEPARDALYAFDRDSSVPVRLDVGDDGTPLGTGAHDPVLSAHGNVVAFAVDTDAGPQIEVVDRDPDGNGKLWPAAGEPIRRTVASRAARGRPGNGMRPSLTDDGRYLSFATNAPGMYDADDRSYGPPGDSDGIVTQVVARDLVQDARREAAGRPRLAAELLSPSRSGCSRGAACGADYPSTVSAISGDGSVTAFLSAADDLTEPGPNATRGAYVRVLEPVASAPAADLGAAQSGSVGRKDVTVSRGGAGPLKIDTVTVGGPNADQFVVSPREQCSGRTMYADDTCVVPVVFVPSGVGSRSADLVVTSGTGSKLTVSLSGVAEAAPSPTPEPTSAPTTTSPNSVAPVPRVSATTAPSPSLTGGPQVQANPGVAVAGRVVTVSGSHFPGETQVVVSVVGDGAPAPVTAQTDRNGAFSVALALLEGGMVGPVQVVATTAAGSRVFGQLLVVPGSYQPPGFVARH